jgi:hypothetical protein
MPLTGYSNKYEKKRGVTVSIDSIGGGGPGYFPPVTQKQEIAQTSVKPTNNVDNNNNCNNNTQSVEQSGYSNNSSALSTEDFLALHNSSQSKSAPVEAMEVVKDVMALKMLEKVLETINDIMK